MFKLLFVYIFILSNLNSQVFESKRDLLKNENKNELGTFSIGIGLTYLNNELVNESKNDNRLNSSLLSDYTYYPNLLIDYRFTKTSDFTIRLNLAYNSLEIKDNYTFITSQDNIEIINNSNSDLTFESVDIDVLIKYNLLGFNSVSLFAGLKTRLQSFNADYEITNNQTEILIKKELKDDNLNYAPLFGVSYNGEYKLINYELFIQYFSYINNIELSSSSDPNIIKFNNTSFGIGLNLKYNLN